MTSSFAKEHPKIKKIITLVKFIFPVQTMTILSLRTCASQNSSVGSPQVSTQWWGLPLLWGVSLEWLVGQGHRFVGTKMNILNIRVYMYAQSTNITTPFSFSVPGGHHVWVDRRFAVHCATNGGQHDQQVGRGRPRKRGNVSLSYPSVWNMQVKFMQKIASKKNDILYSSRIVAGMRLLEGEMTILHKN